MISYHRDRKNIGKKSLYSTGWVTAVCHGAEEIAGYLVSFMTSPCLWRDGVRREAEWLGADWVALDFDDGVLLSDALVRFRAHTHVIGTTKSHQLPKGTAPAHDRFRVWLRLSHRCTTLAAYKYGVRQLVRQHGADPQAADGARMFMPCKEIASVVEVGGKISLEKEPVRVKPDHGFAPRGGVPLFVKAWLAGGVPQGQKNKFCFRIGAILTRGGFSEGEIVDMIMASAIPSAPTEVVRREVACAVRNGARRGAAEGPLP